MKVNGRKNKEKIVSICVVGALVCTLGIGVFSVISGTKDNKEIKNNVVDLNEQNSEDSNNNGLDNIVGFNVEDADEVSKDTESIFRGDVNEKDYVGMDNTIYFKTLGAYKCNPAMCISADVGTKVGVAADGIVESVTDSTETGKTVRVAVGNGYVVTYGLMNDVNVKAGDVVSKEQLLGTVSEPTAYYKEEGPMLYFMVTKDDVPVDPNNFLAQE